MFARVTLKVLSTLIVASIAAAYLAALTPLVIGV